MTLTVWLLGTLIALALVCVVMLALLLRRAPLASWGPLDARLSAIERMQERTDRAVREELAQGRDESLTVSRQLREEMQTALRAASDAVTRSVASLGEGSERRLESVRETVDQRMAMLQRDNSERLEEMRRTVDERLQTTLDARLGASFQLVSERLEQVHRGLGEMQALATGVGDLKRVLANVKARGTWGEVQLRGLLEQGLAADQFAANVATKEGSAERVEFAIRLPGAALDDEVVWLPIDAKFPLEDYQRMLDAVERGDLDGGEQFGKQLETRLKTSAKEIRDKYLNPPRTTDFAILFLPTEGLFSEALRRPGLLDALQRDHRVVVTGPTTLWAVVCALQMGFRTLLIQRRSSEVWRLLASVKLEFSRFGEALDSVQRKLSEATTKVDVARRGTRTIQRRLEQVQIEPVAPDLLDVVQMPLGVADDE